MRYFEAKVLVPDPIGIRGDGVKVITKADHQARERWESSLLHLYGGFHKGPPVQGRTLRWGDEKMVPYHVAFELETVDLSAPLGFLTRKVKEIFAQEAVYIAVTELAAPFIH